MLKVPRYIAIEYMCEILYKRSKNAMSKVSKIQCTDLNALNGIMSEMVFAAFTQHCMQSTESTDFMSEMSKILYSVLCIQWPLAPPGGKARCSRTICLVGLAVHHQPVRGGSFVLKCSGTCQSTRVIAGKTHSPSPILKCYGGCSATQ